MHTRASRARAVRPSRRPWHAIASAPFLLALALGGCGSDHALTLLESDVPAPPEMDVRYSFDIARDGGELSAGRFILAGALTDLERAAEETIARYSGNGWTLRDRTTQPAQQTLVFEKGPRRATVELIRRRVDPEMSSAVIVLSRGG